MSAMIESARQRMRRWRTTLSIMALSPCGDPADSHSEQECRRDCGKRMFGDEIFGARRDVVQGRLQLLQEAVDLHFAFAALAGWRRGARQLDRRRRGPAGDNSGLVQLGAERGKFGAGRLLWHHCSAWRMRAYAFLSSEPRISAAARTSWAVRSSCA